MYRKTKIGDLREMSDYIEGAFILWWGSKSYKCHERSLFVPKYATLRITPDRIYINHKFVKKQIKKFNIIKDKMLREKACRDRDGFYELKRWISALNSPYIKPEVIKSSIKTELI